MNRNMTKLGAIHTVGHITIWDLSVSAPRKHKLSSDDAAEKAGLLIGPLFEVALFGNDLLDIHVFACRL